MTRLYRMILAITEAWGPEAARAKLRALARGPIAEMRRGLDRVNDQAPLFPTKLP